MAGIMTLPWFCGRNFTTFHWLTTAYIPAIQKVCGALFCSSCMQAGVIISLISFPSLLCCLWWALSEGFQGRKPGHHFSHGSAGLAFARHSFHIGASGLRTGWSPFILVRYFQGATGGQLSCRWWYWQPTAAILMVVQPREGISWRNATFWCSWRECFLPLFWRPWKRKEKNRQKAITALKKPIFAQRYLSIYQRAERRHACWGIAEEKKNAPCRPGRTGHKPAIPYRPCAIWLPECWSCSRIWLQSCGQCCTLCLVACLWVSHLNGDVSCFPATMSLKIFLTYSRHLIAVGGWHRLREKVFQAFGTKFGLEQTLNYYPWNGRIYI